jgi:signal transduction histidine kinase
VSDTGIGISEADQRKLFRLFGKLTTSSNMNTSGIGLGLNICKKIVETFGGGIYLQSKVGEGSHFTFTIQTGEQPNQSDEELKV